MNFELTQEQLLLQKTAREFAQNKLLPGIIERDETSVFPMDLLRNLVKQAHTVYLTLKNTAAPAAATWTTSLVLKRFQRLTAHLVFPIRLTRHFTEAAL